MNPRRLFIASCIALVASAFSFVIRGDILPALGETFDLTQRSRGGIAGAAFMGMATSMLFGSPVCDHFGMKRMLGMAFGCHVLGSLLTVFAPNIVPAGNADFAYWVLWLAMFLVGCANGFVEVGINPLAATLYPARKTHMLNVLHAWWPGGLFIGGFLASILINKAMGLGDDGTASSRDWMIAGWRIKAALVFIPTAIYGALFFYEKFPVTERVASGVSSSQMFSEALRPMFLLWAFCMLLTASVELGPQQWQNSVLTKTSGLSGTYIIMYTSFLMFLLRHFAGPIAHKLSPVGMLTISAVLTAIGLYALSFANSATTAFATATIYGLGIVYFWPTMLGVTAERFPRGGAFLLGLMGCVGNLAIAAILPIMGQIYDTQTLGALPADVRPKVVNSAGELDPEQLHKLPKDVADPAEIEGAKWAFRYVSALPVVLVVIFGSIALYDRSRGGYKPEELPAEASVASDY